MPKIRGVKPDYWTDEDIVDLSIPARLLFIGLWSYACDNGHLQDKPKQIKMRILPGDDVNATELLAELEASGRIKRGDGWITIPNLTEHQKPDLRYFTTCDKDGCEDPPEKVSQRESRRAHSRRPPGAQGAPNGRTAGAHVDGDGDGEVMVKVRGGDKPPARKRAHSLPDDFQPNETNRRIAAECHIDVDALLPKFKDWAIANGSRYVDWHAALNTWIRREKPAPREARPRTIPHVSQIEEPPDGLNPEEYRDWHAAQRRKWATQ